MSNIYSDLHRNNYMKMFSVLIVGFAFLLIIPALTSATVLWNNPDATQGIIGANTYLYIQGIPQNISGNTITGFFTKLRCTTPCVFNYGILRYDNSTLIINNTIYMNNTAANYTIGVGGAVVFLPIASTPIPLTNNNTQYAFFMNSTDSSFDIYGGSSVDINDRFRTNNSLASGNFSGVAIFNAISQSQYIEIDGDLQPQLSITFSPPPNITYPTAENTSCALTSGNKSTALTMYSNGVIVAAGTFTQSDIFPLTIGETNIFPFPNLYNYTCEVAPTFNTPYAFISKNLTVLTLQNTTLLNLGNRFENVTSCLTSALNYPPNFNLFPNGLPSCIDCTNFCANCGFWLDQSPPTQNKTTYQYCLQHNPPNPQITCLKGGTQIYPNSTGICCSTNITFVSEAFNVNFSKSTFADTFVYNASGVFCNNVVNNFLPISSQTTTQVFDIVAQFGIGLGGAFIFAGISTGTIGKIFKETNKLKFFLTTLLIGVALMSFVGLLPIWILPLEVILVAALFVKFGKGIFGG